MGRGQHCSEEKGKLIKKLLSEGKTYKFIQDLLGCSSKMIANAKKWEEKPETRGRKRKIASHEVKKLVRLARQDPFITSTKIKQELDLDVNTSTIRRRLIENKLCGRSPRKTPLLKPIHVRNRKQFAQDHREWPASKWRNILWTDESKIVLFGSAGRRQYIRRPENTAYNPKYTVKTVKHGGAKINIWACFSYYGPGPIFWIKSNMDAKVYVDILETIMLPFAEENMPLKWIFMQDNDPKHTSRLAKAWFSTNGVHVMDWPAQSPDLNPIENLWGYVKEVVFKTKPATVEELWAVVKSTWCSIPVEKCQNLVNSMQRRCAAVISNKGYTINY